MTSLGTLRRRLTLLRWSRAAVRWWVALARLLALALGVLWLVLLLDVFVLEPAFRHGLLPRLAVDLAAVAVLAWLLGRFVRPLLASGESLLQTALLVERKLGIASDLVAALQFDQASAARRDAPSGSSHSGSSHSGLSPSGGSSARLEQAVIAEAARRTADVRVFRQVPLRRAARTVLWLAPVAVCWLLALARGPDHVAVFFDRLLLGSRHYPTTTQIRRVLVNDRDVGEAAVEGGRTGAIRAARAEPVAFAVVCQGVLPSGGRLLVRSVRTGRTRDVALRPATAEQRRESAGEGRRRQRYEARLEPLLEPLTFQVEIGDAWTAPFTLELIPRPLVELAWRVEPPAYARGAALPDSSSDRLRHVVLGGSRMIADIRSINGKPLQAAWLSIRGTAGSERVGLVPKDDSRLEWSTPGDTHSLSRVSEELQYELQVRDQDGLSLEQPLTGSIRLRDDRPPHATIGSVHRFVLPEATPAIEYRLLDDYGIANARLIVETERRPEAAATDSTASSLAASTSAPAEPPGEDPPESLRERAEVPLLVDRPPIPVEHLPLTGRYSLDLSRWTLRKGDRLKVSLDVEDFRGESDGSSYRTEGLVFEVTDEKGVLREISQGDARAEQALTEIITRQLGIGETP